MSTLNKILIVEDDPAMQATLDQALRREDYGLFLASSFREGAQFFEAENPDVVLLDINLPDRSGRELFEHLRAQDDEAVIIVLTAFPDLRSAVAMMKAGAFDYLVKPFDLTELKIAIRKGLEINRLKTEVIRLKRHERDCLTVEAIVGESGATRGLREDILRVAAASHSTVLITGESGTGKELVAQAIHAHSPRAGGPLVTINCSAIPEHLVESELFGHERGAFTGATQATKGVFELASGGTLFLDEIGELPLAIQPKLLRALESRRIKRIGASREIPVDIRLVAATNRNLAEAVARGEFREDLYFRINVIPLHIPPLRERAEDIRPLLAAVSGELARRTGLPPVEWAPPALRQIERYPWPGNVREMRNLIERMMILHGHKGKQVVIGAEQLPHEMRPAPRAPLAAADPDDRDACTLEEMERRHIATVMKRFENNKSEVSRRLGISRNTLKEKLNRYGLSG
ncbi:MAG: sigma-54-dependent Fis family transcriptional regulator [Candidatus Lambdaproteobacteria bacterium]|nr:sigma-54-dependent Fis family transcriptional regulator [Candidatus Lambdaproteobacteria bacterium]